LGAEVHAVRLSSLATESQLQVARSVTDLQDALAWQKGKGGKNPSSPPSKRNDPSRQVITPSQRVIQKIKEEA
jgi:hypothetical protein